jgi:hypothetical protein
MDDFDLTFGPQAGSAAPLVKRDPVAVESQLWMRAYLQLYVLMSEHVDATGQPMPDLCAPTSTVYIQLHRGGTHR